MPFWSVHNSSNQQVPWSSTFRAKSVFFICTSCIYPIRTRPVNPNFRIWGTMCEHLAGLGRNCKRNSLNTNLLWGEAELQQPSMMSDTQLNKRPGSADLEEAIMLIIIICFLHEKQICFCGHNGCTTIDNDMETCKADTTETIIEELLSVPLRQEYCPGIARTSFTHDAADNALNIFVHFFSTTSGHRRILSKLGETRYCDRA